MIWADSLERAFSNEAGEFASPCDGQLLSMDGRLTLTFQSHDMLAFLMLIAEMDRHEPAPSPQVSGGREHHCEVGSGEDTNAMRAACVICQSSGARDSVVSARSGGSSN